MIAKNLIKKEIDNQLKNLESSLSKAAYSRDCDMYLEKIKNLNNTLNNKEKLLSIESIYRLIEEDESSFKLMESNLKNEDFISEIKKELLTYPFKKEESQLIRQIRAYYDYVITEDIEILVMNAKHEATMEQFSNYCYYKLLKLSLNNKTREHKALLDLIYFRTASTSDLLTNEEIMAHSKVIILSSEQVSVIKRCYNYSPKTSLNKKLLSEKRECIENLQEKLKLSIYEKNEMYSF